MQTYATRMLRNQPQGEKLPDFRHVTKLFALLVTRRNLQIDSRFGNTFAAGYANIMPLLVARVDPLLRGSSVLPEVLSRRLDARPPQPPPAARP